MAPGAGPAPGRHVPANLLLLGAVALLYGTLEYVWQGWVSPPPASLPGGAGASWPMMAALAWLVIVGPGLLVAGLAWRVSDPARGWLVLVAGIAPTSLVVLDRFSQVYAWPWMAVERGGSHHVLRLLLATALAASVAALVLGRWPGKRLEAVGAPLRTYLAVVLLTALAPAVFWTSRHEIPLPERATELPSSDLPNILVLTIDTLRQDAIGAYGGPAAGTLDSLIATGTRFDGWSVSSWTRPSMASFFAGIAPTATGVSADHAMRADLPTWVERLRAEGYSTAAVASNPHLRARFGFDRGFDYFEHSDHVEWLAPVVRSFWGIWLQRQLVDRRETDRGDRVVERTASWLRRSEPDGRPWMLWVHMMDPHLPYHLRGEHGERVARTTPTWIADLGAEFRDGFFRDLPAVREGRALTSPSARKALRRLYQREVLFADRQVRRLLDLLGPATDERGLLWVLASDHGEEFWDDGGYEHGHSLHESVLRVPLALGGVEGLPAGAFGGPLRLSDVGPTVLGVLQLEGFDPAAGAEIDSLDAPLQARLVGADRSASVGGLDSGCEWPELLAEGMFYGPPQTRLLGRHGRDILVREDPYELTLRELCRTAPATEVDALTPTERRWLVELDQWRERWRERSQRVEDDPELDRRLRSLGYVK